MLLLIYYRFLKLKKLLERVFIAVYLLFSIFYRFLKLKKFLERVFAWVNLFLKIAKIFSRKYPPGLHTSTLRT